MTRVKASSKKGQQLLARARYIKGRCLADVYTTCSRAKQEAYDLCALQCTHENGENFHICSHNSNFFSVAWEVENGVRMETAYNSFLIEM